MPAFATLRTYSVAKHEGAAAVGSGVEAGKIKHVPSASDLMTYIVPEAVAQVSSWLPNSMALVVSLILSRLLY